MKFGLWNVLIDIDLLLKKKKRDESSNIHIFEVEHWLVQAFRDEEERIEREAKAEEEVAARKKEWEEKEKKFERKKKAEEKKLRRKEKKRIKAEKFRVGQLLAKEMYEELEDAYKKDKFGKYKKSMGFVPKGMSKERFLETKKVLKEFNI